MSGTTTLRTATVGTPPVGALPTSDGGARQGEADLWCSYAAVRTLRWLNRGPTDPAGVADFLLSRRNDDGGFGWQRGLPSDVWATYYCAQALADLGREGPPAEQLSSWLATIRTDEGGFAMTPGQSADVWATYYACRLFRDIVTRPLPRPAELAAWLGRLQTADGGLGWAPGSAAADVRAGYYGALAWAAAGSRAPVQPAWDRARLVAWLRDQQRGDGGFGFTADVTPCTWAAFRATGALQALGATPRDPKALLRWLSERSLPEGGFERWPGYGQADVWSAFTVVGTWAHLDHTPPPTAAQALSSLVQGCQLPGSGFTYREPAAAGDSLATAAALLTETVAPTPLPTSRPDPARYVDWLRRAQTAHEGGVMYMPGRGAEIRCTLWAATALRRAGAGLDLPRLTAWLRELQNPDGGVGYWMGRGSDLTSTASAVEAAIVAELDPIVVFDPVRLASFVTRCGDIGSASNVPGGRPTLTAAAQSARIRQAVRDDLDLTAVSDCLQRHASSLGGWASTPRSVPDLMSTYQAVLTAQTLGLPWSGTSVRRLLARLAAGDGFAWSPLSRRSGGPLADCLGRLLEHTSAQHACAGRVDALPRLNL